MSIVQTGRVRRPEFPSPAARAVAPVVAGLGFFAILGLVMWGIAAVMSGEQAQTTTLTPDRLRVGDIRRWSTSIDENGPVLFPGLGTLTGTRTIVLDHDGDNPERGWVIRYAFPADRDETCAVEQEPGTDAFLDCEGRTIQFADLAPVTNGEYPVIEDRTNLYIDLGDRPLDSDSTTDPAVPAIR